MFLSIIIYSTLR